MTVPGRIVILTGSDLQHRYVARALADLPGVVGIVVTQQPHLSFGRRIKRAIKRFGLGGTVSRGFLKLALRASGEMARRKADLARVLGRPEFPDNVPIFETIGVNSEQTQTLLRDLAPDILCVYGTYVVTDATLSIARQIALNLHTGISPRYRGADCEFWPLHEQELDFIGATVHACTATLDGGAIFGTARAKLEAEDGIGAVFGRCVVAGSALYKRVVDDLIASREIKSLAQDLTMGREYKVTMRGWRAEARVAKLIWSGLLRKYVTKRIENDSSSGNVK